MEVQMFLKLILGLSIGCLVCRRTIIVLKRAHIMSTSHSNQLQWLYLAALLPSVFVASSHFVWWVLTWMIVLVVLPVLLAAVIEGRRRREFVAETGDFYDELILEMRGGQSLRSSLENILNLRRYGFHTLEMAAFALQSTTDVAQQPDFESTRDPMLRIRARELCELLYSTHRVLEQLLFLRWLHRLQERFRRKSSSVTQQVRAQAAVVVCLYAGLCGLQVVFGHLSIFSFWVVGSGSLLFLGLMTLQYILRSFRWKV
jgi:Flp pilus assembly protein TadB